MCSIICVERWEGEGDGDGDGAGAGAGMETFIEREWLSPLNSIMFIPQAMQCTCISFGIINKDSFAFHFTTDRIILLLSDMVWYDRIWYSPVPVCIISQSLLFDEEERRWDTIVNAGNVSFGSDVLGLFNQLVIEQASGQRTIRCWCWCSGCQDKHLHFIRHRRIAQPAKDFLLRTQHRRGTLHSAEVFTRDAECRKDLPFQRILSINS